MPTQVQIPQAVRWLKCLDQRRTRVAILGMGYVGLPLGLLFAEKGLHVLGLDPDTRRVQKLRAGTSPIRHIPTATVRRLVRSGHLQADTDPTSLGRVDAAIICVPTPLTKQREPDLSYVEAAARQIALHARKGLLVVLESTTYPGTTAEVIEPIFAERGWKRGVDYFLAFSPEREDPKNPHFSTANIPKVVGADDPVSRALAEALYRVVVREVVPVSSTRVAEAAKLLENIFRSVNIALVNELKVVLDRMGIDVWEVVDAAKTKPFGFMPFYPGPGLGGHCIPIDPFYLTWKAREFDISTKFIELAGEINTSMPYYVLSKTVEALGSKGRVLKGARVLLLGLAYKKDVDDARESPAVKLKHLLEERGAVVSYHDPYIPVYRGENGEISKSVPLTPAQLRRFHVVLVVTDHTGVDYPLVRREASLIVDTRRLWKPDGKKVFAA
jgi:UDP-N-acetyl-D-glucosamine dehydrogenase